MLSKLFNKLDGKLNPLFNIGCWYGNTRMNNQAW